MSAQPVRVLVVDDSALMRKLIPQILSTDSAIEVVGTAMDGNFGLKKIVEEMERLAQSEEKFAPCEILKKHARDGTQFYER